MPLTTGHRSTAIGGVSLSSVTGCRPEGRRQLRDLGVRPRAPGTPRRCQGVAPCPKGCQPCAVSVLDPASPAAGAGRRADGADPASAADHRRDPGRRLPDRPPQHPADGRPAAGGGRRHGRVRAGRGRACGCCWATPPSRSAQIVLTVLMGLLGLLVLQQFLVWLTAILSRVSLQTVLGEGFAPATTRATWRASLPLFWPMLGLSLLQWRRGQRGADRARPALLRRRASAWWWPGSRTRPWPSSG